MEMEKPLPAGAPSPSPEKPVAPVGGGIAAQLAAQDGLTAPPSPVTPKRLGRPPTHGRYTRAAGSDGKNPVAPAAAPAALQAEGVDPSPGPDADVSLPPDLLAKVVSEGLGAAEAFAAGKIESAARMAGLTADEIAPQLDQARIGDKRKQLVGELTPLALQEWGVDPKMSPSGAIMLILGPWAVGAFTSYKTLAALAEEKAKRQEEKK